MTYQFNAPPGWPTPPAGWIPPQGWRPDPTWPAAPKGWSFWNTYGSAPTLTRTAIVARAQGGQMTLEEAVQNPYWPPASIGWLFNPPPGWPIQGGDWRPPDGWEPEPYWTPAPDGWQFWTSKIAYRHRKLAAGSILTAIIGIVAVISGIGSGDAGSAVFGIFSGLLMIGGAIWAGWTTLGWLHVKELAQPQKLFVYVIGLFGMVSGFCIWIFIWFGFWMLESMANS